MRFLATHLLVFALLSAPLPAGAQDRDVLWHIVSTCVDTGASDYCSRCRSPRAEYDCHTCRDTIEVWTESPDFVAMSDRKACGCPSGFVHGLAVPKSRVTGFEDPQRPDGIWKFAWEAGMKRVGKNELALAVNPKSKRSQDQLHVHMVRVKRERLPTDPKRISRVDSLDRVWYVAAKKAADLEWRDHGVLVTMDPGGRYLVVVDDGSPEFDYTVAQCGGPPTM